MGSTTVAPKAIKNPDGTTTEQAGKTYSSPALALIDQTFDKQGNLMGRASGGGLLGSVPGIVKPSASATIKAPEPTPEPKEASNMQMFVGSDLADKAEFSRKTGLTEVDPRTEKRIKELEEVKDDLLAKAKERRSKTQEVKEEAMSAMSMPSDLSQFGIQNYRAGGAKFDRGDTKSVGDDMNTGKPSTQERIKSFLGETMTDPRGFAARVRGV